MTSSAILSPYTATDLERYDRGPQIGQPACPPSDLTTARRNRPIGDGDDPADIGDGGAFKRDHAKVLAMASLRALGGKTQALDAGDVHAPRTRLTHSLEVGHACQAIGLPLGADPDLLQLAGLAHDLGHPPFGHNGQQALDEMTAAAGGFQANAQTWRILTRLAPGPIQGAGANLTRAALDATCKYPWPRLPRIHAFGVYDDDLPTFDWVRTGINHPRPSFEAQVMDWADDLCNAAGDIDDAVRARLIDPRCLTDPDTLADVAALAHDRLVPRSDTTLDIPTIAAAAAETSRISAAAWLTRHGYDATANARAALTQWGHDLRDSGIRDAIRTTRQTHGPGPHRRHQGDLETSTHGRAVNVWLRALILRDVLRDPQRSQRRARQRDILCELHHAVAQDAPATLSPELAPSWRETRSDAERLRLITDHIASLTEDETLTRHRLLRSRRHGTDRAGRPG